MSGFNGWRDWNPNTHTVETGKKPSKYKAQKTVVDGITFDSKKEAARYSELKALEKAGEIRSLELQPRFELCAGQDIGMDDALVVPIGAYVADFQYLAPPHHNDPPGAIPMDRWVAVVEDVKGFKTPLYRWKKKHAEAQYGITILET